MVKLPGLRLPVSASRCFGNTTSTRAEESGTDNVNMMTKRKFPQVHIFGL